MVAELVGEGWRSGPVRVAGHFRDRWRGLRPRPTWQGLLIGTRSVHTFGMTVPLWVCGLREMLVIQVELVRPGRIVWIRRADSMLELAIEVEPPTAGLHLSWLDARPADPVRHSDRQSG